MLTGVSSPDLLWLLLTFGLLVYAASRVAMFRDRAWVFRFAFLSLALGLFIGRVRMLPQVDESGIGRLLRNFEAALAVVALALMAVALVTKRVPRGSANSAGPGN